MPYTVTARGIVKSFGDRRVLDHVDLSIEHGHVLALLGPNGAGKTTLVRILATLTRLDAGSATIAGHNLRTDPAGVRRSISLTGQHVAVDDLLTGAENLQLMGRLLHLPRRRAAVRAAELLEEFGLADAAGQRAGTYSGGMRRRLDLAISMIERPELLFLDEPTTGLDPRSREQVWAAVSSLAAAGVTILLTTQYLEEADVLADRIVLLDRGRVAAEGTADELKASLGAQFIRLRFADAAAYGRARTLLDPVTTDDRLCTVEVVTDGSARDLYATLDQLSRADFAAATVSIIRPSLDDVFRSVTEPTAPGGGPSKHATHNKHGNHSKQEAVR
jgi:ABC-2 type transport system ATP-binding protein